MALLMRSWRKYQAHRESALVDALEESRVQAAVATEAAVRTETQRDTARSACLAFQLARVENRATVDRERSELARVKTESHAKTKMLKRTEAQKQARAVARSACNEYLLGAVTNRADAYRASSALAQVENDLDNMVKKVARAQVQTQASALQRLGMLSLNEATIAQEMKAEQAERALATCLAKFEECRSSLQSAREQTARASVQAEAVEEAARKGRAQAQQQQVRESSDPPAASNVELDEDGFGLTQMKEVMLLSMEELKQEGARDQRRGRASPTVRAKRKAAAPGTRRKGEEKKDPPAKASNNRWAVLAGDDDEDDDEDEGDQGKGAKGETPADTTPATSPTGRSRTRGKSPSPSRRRANNGHERR
ncbi:unnamed protein product [Ectocarpus fasciculatus]